MQPPPKPPLTRLEMLRKIRKERQRFVEPQTLHEEIAEMFGELQNNVHADNRAAHTPNRVCAEINPVTEHHAPNDLWRPEWAERAERLAAKKRKRKALKA